MPADAAFKLKLGTDVGFSIGAGQKVSFDSSKLGDLVAKLAPMLIDPEAIAIGEGAAAFLSLFTVTSNIHADGTLNTTAAESVELTIVPAFLQKAQLTVVP